MKLIDKELLRLELEAKGYDTSKMDMDLALESEKIIKQQTPGKKLEE